MRKEEEEATLLQELLRLFLYLALTQKCFEEISAETDNQFLCDQNCKSAIAQQSILQEKTLQMTWSDKGEQISAQVWNPIMQLTYMTRSSERKWWKNSEHAITMSSSQIGKDLPAGGALRHWKSFLWFRRSRDRLHPAYLVKMREAVALLVAVAYLAAAQR